MTGFSVHCCLIDKQCRSYGAPPRLHVNTPWLHVGVALRPSARFARFANDDRDVIETRWTDCKRQGDEETP
jgi:hypothetical protein